MTSEVRRRAQVDGVRKLMTLRTSPPIWRALVSEGDVRNDRVIGAVDLAPAFRLGHSSPLTDTDREMLYQWLSLLGTTGSDANMFFWSVSARFPFDEPVPFCASHGKAFASFLHMPEPTRSDLAAVHNRAHGGEPRDIAAVLLMPASWAIACMSGELKRVCMPDVKHFCMGWSNLPVAEAIAAAVAAVAAVAAATATVNGCKKNTSWARPAPPQTIHMLHIPPAKKDLVVFGVSKNLPCTRRRKKCWMPFFISFYQKSFNFDKKLSLEAEAGRERQRKAEKGRERQRKAEKCRENHRFTKIL